MAKDSTSGDVDVLCGNTTQYLYGRNHGGGGVPFAPWWGYYHNACGWGNGVQIRTRRKLYRIGVPYVGPVIGQWQTWNWAERSLQKHVHALDGNINHPTGEFCVEMRALGTPWGRGTGPADNHPAGYQGSSMHLSLDVYWNAV
ncbi:hypothetical protein [Microbacterium sp.]|uniref:hypothetical protein n=1 Tax=Microbacterium sp. TaxID=51671 RepID=UPI0039E3B270